MRQEFCIKVLSFLLVHNMHACAFLSGAAVNFATFSASYKNIWKVVDDLSPITKENKQDKATNCIHNVP